MYQHKHNANHLINAHFSVLSAQTKVPSAHSATSLMQQFTTVYLHIANPFSIWVAAANRYQKHRNVILTDARYSSAEHRRGLSALTKWKTVRRVTAWAQC